MEAQLAALRATVESGFTHVNRRFDDLTVRADRIETQTRETNGRVTRHDEQIKTLFRRTASTVKTEMEKLPLTLVALRWWIAAIGISISGTYYVVVEVLGFHR